MSAISWDKISIPFFLYVSSTKVLMLPIATSFNTAKAAPFRSCALVSGALSATAACSAVVLLSKSPVPSSAVRFKPCVGDGFALVSGGPDAMLRPPGRFTCCGDTFGFAFASEVGIACLLSFALSFGSSGISCGGSTPLGSTGLPSASSTLISLSSVETTAGFGLSLSWSSLRFFACAWILSAPVSSFSIAAMILQASVWGTVVLRFSRAQVQPGQPSVAPCLCTSSLLMYRFLLWGGATRASGGGGGTTNRSSPISRSPATGLGAVSSQGIPLSWSHPVGSHLSAFGIRRNPVPRLTPCDVISIKDPVRPWCPTYRPSFRTRVPSPTSLK